MIDTAVYILGYRDGFTVNDSLVESFTQSNPLTRKNGAAIAWYDSDPTVPNRRVDPTTGLLYSRATTDPYVDIPLGRLSFYPTYCTVTVELPRVLYHDHNAALLSFTEAQAAFDLHVMALTTEFPFLDDERLTMLQLDVYYQTYVPNPQATIRKVFDYYQVAAVAPSSVRYRQTARQIGYSWAGNQDSKHHLFNIYNKAEQMFLCDGLKDLAREHAGLTRVTERVGLRDARDFTRLYDAKNRRFLPAGIHALLMRRYAGYQEGGEVANMDELVKRHGVYEALGMVQCAQDSGLFERNADALRYAKTTGGYRAHKSRELGKLTEVKFADACRPFELPPLADMHDLFATRDDPYVLPLAQVHAVNFDDMDFNIEADLRDATRVDHDKISEDFLPDYLT